MRISQVCIDRPVLASVMSIVIALFVFLLGVAGIARVAAARSDEDDDENTGGEKSYLEEVTSPEESHEAISDEGAEADTEEAVSTADDESDVETEGTESDGEASDVAPWDDV